MWVSLLDFYAPATKWDKAYSFTLDYDGPNGSLFISILLHNSEFRIFFTANFGIRNCEVYIIWASGNS